MIPDGVRGFLAVCPHNVVQTGRRIQGVRSDRENVRVSRVRQPRRRERNDAGDLSGQQMERKYPSGNQNELNEKEKNIRFDEPNPA
jgi:hypothetical protein